MKYSIVFKRDALTRKIKDHIIKNFNGFYDEANPEVVFTIGGDGTVLDAVRKYIHMVDEVVFITINTGNLGFYTEFLPEDLDEIFKLLEQENKRVKYPLLEFSVDGKVNYALNEIVFRVSHHLFEGEVLVDDISLMDIRSDGICISTPSGSTAYNKSLKGAIMDREIETMQLVVMAPFETINNRVISPLVLNKNREVVIRPKSKYFDLSFDRSFITYQKVEEIKIKLSDKKVSFLKNITQNFPKRLKEKFISKN